MQANYALWRGYPNNAARNDRCHAELLEDQGFLQVDELRAIAGDATFESGQRIRLSHPLAAHRLLNKPDGPEY